MTERIERVTGPEAILISSSRKKPEWEGKTLKDISEIMGLSPTETAIEILKIEDPAVIAFMMDPAEVEYFMTKPYVMTSSDGMNVPFGMSKPHPRNYGAFTKKIRDFVLDKNVLTMEFAIRAATTSNQPQSRGLPLTAPYSFPRFLSNSPSSSLSLVGIGPAPTRVIYPL